jgi:hypothetical protein
MLLFKEQRLSRLSTFSLKRIVGGQKFIVLHSQWSKRYSPILSAFRLCLFVIIFFLTGCSGLGPRKVQLDRFSYNDAIAQSTQSQMMLNLVRIRYLEEPILILALSRTTEF